MRWARTSGNRVNPYTYTYTYIRCEPPYKGYPNTVFFTVKFLILKGRTEYAVGA